MSGKYLIGESLREKLKSTIAKVDSIPFGGPVSRIPTIASSDGPTYVPKVFRVCTATGAWPINSSKTVTFYGVTSTPNTVNVVNQIVSLPSPRSTATSRIVNVAKDGTQWYLISFQMGTQTAVFATATQTMTFVGTGSTQAITFVGAASTQTISFVGRAATETISYPTLGPTVNALVDVSAVLNTNNCTITVNKTTRSVQTVGSMQSATVVNIAGTQTATVVNMAGTQTATIMSMSGTQTATVFAGTFTATYITLEL
jgi:hypothetical protein